MMRIRFIDEADPVYMDEAELIDVGEADPVYVDEAVPVY